MDRTPTRRHCPGFTLIEMIAVVAVIAVLAAIAIPGFSVWLPDYRLKQAARDVFSNLQLAKLHAVKNNTTCTVTFNKGAGTYSITDGGGASLKAVDLSDYGSGIGYGCGNATDNIPGAGAPPADPISYNPDSTTFNFRGTMSAVDDKGYVYLCNNKGSSYGIGTPSMAGVIISRKWKNGAWQ